MLASIEMVTNHNAHMHTTKATQTEEGEREGERE